MCIVLDNVAGWATKHLPISAGADIQTVPHLPADQAVQ